MNRWRKHPWLARSVAFGFGLLLIAAFELALRLLGWGMPSDYEDPFVGFSRVHPLFVLNPSTARYEIPKGKQKFFSPDAFPAEKPDGSFRIFCLGGSTVKGRPYSKETSFTTWLELGLEAADPSRKWEVVNCGGISYASYRLVPILTECLGYEPDLFVICTGHNEFLEDRTYESIRDASGALQGSHRAASRWHTYTLFRAAIMTLSGRREPSAPAQRFVMPGEVEALLDYRGGLEAYDRNPAWKADVIRHYRHNLRTMIELAEQAGVPVVLIRPPSNLRDSPPFKSLHREDLTLDEVIEWEKLVEAAKSHYRDDLPKSAALLRQALEIDPLHAATWYELGKCLEALGQRDAARAAFLNAREHDICPLRMVAAQETALSEIASDTGTPLVDAHALLESQSRLRILGNDVLVDHIHPSIEGHQQIAGALLDVMEEQHWVRREKDWKQRRDTAFKRHRDSLPGTYFIEAQRALYGLQSWAAGRVDGPPIQSKNND